MSKHLIGTIFYTLEHVVGETLVNLYVQPLLFQRQSLSLERHHTKRRLIVIDDVLSK